MGLPTEMIEDIKDIKKVLIILAAIEYIKMSGNQVDIKDAVKKVKSLAGEEDE